MIKKYIQIYIKKPLLKLHQSNIDYSNIFKILKVRINVIILDKVLQFTLMNLMLICKMFILILTQKYDCLLYFTPKRTNRKLLTNDN